MKDAVLAIRPRALGDLVLLTPALRALRRGHPGADIEIVTETRFVPFVSDFAEVDRVWALRRHAAATLRLALALRRRRYRAVVDFFGNPRTALLAATCRTSLRAGFDVRRRRRVYDMVVAREAVLPGAGREYGASIHVRLAVAAGGVMDGLEPRIELPADADARADALLARAGVRAPRRCVGLVAAGTWATKTWPLSHSTLLARRLLDAGWEVLALTGPGEERVAGVLAAFASGVAVLPPCGMRDLAAVIRRLGGVVGTDSGPRHLAAALGVPTFAWFGPTHPESWTGPGPHAYWRTPLPCAGCNRTVCSHWNCMPGLTPAEAARQVLSHLEAHGSTADIGSAART